MTRRLFWRRIVPAALVAAVAVYFVWLREPNWDADPEVRAAAEWLASLGEVREQDKITPATASRIESISVVDLSWMKIEDRSNRLFFMERDWLTIHRYTPNFPTGGLSTLASLPRLRSLRLELPPRAGDDAAATSVGRVVRLTDLRWRGTGMLTDAAFVHFGRLTNLSQLDLLDEIATDARLRSLAGLTKLETLDLRKFDLGDALGVLAEFPKLRALGLDEGTVRAGGVAHLGRIATLQGLGLNRSRVEGTLAPIARLSRLRRLILVEALLDDEQLASLAGAPAVEFLNASKVKAGRKAMAAFASMPKLETLHLDDASLTDGWEGLGGAPALATLVARRTEIQDRHGAGLGSIKALKMLTLEETAAGDLTAEALAGLPLLETLVMHKTKLTDAGLAHLARAPKLDTLYLGETGITDAGLAHIAKAPALKYLDLRETRVTDAGVRVLMDLKTLKSLTLTKTSVSDALVEELRRSRPELSISK